MSDFKIQSNSLCNFTLYRPSKKQVSINHSLVNESGNISLIFSDSDLISISPYEAAKLILILKKSINESITITQSMIE